MRIPLAILALLPALAHAAPPDRFESDVRASLEQLVDVDTSHGHETDALQPIAKQLRDAGLHVELLESEPGRGNLVARYKGNGKKKPLLLLAHVDVVPVEGQPWTVPPFKLTEKDGFLWGRGVNDQKAMASVIVALALELAREKPVLSRDVIFALTSGEETGGLIGAAWLCKHHPELLDAELALNEGGSVRLSDDLSRVTEVTLGVAEKTFQSYRVRVKGKGGHSSVPPTDFDPVVHLARAVERIDEHRFPAHVLSAVRAGLPAQAKFHVPPISDALLRVAASGQVTPDDDRVLSTDRFINASLRTTCVTTQLSGAPQDNVLPTSAEAVVNCRILPDETPAQTLAALKSVVGDPAVELAPMLEVGVGPYSPEHGVGPDAIAKVAHATWPDAAIHPDMSAGATDSRHLRGLGILAYGVSASPLSRAENEAGHGAHGPDERRPAKWLGPGARYLRELMYELAK